MGLDIMKKTYISPELCSTTITFAESIMQLSNQVTSSSVNLNPTTMGEGSGSDAVKSNTYDVWDDDWSR